MPYLPRNIYIFSFGQGMRKERVAPQHSLTVIESVASFLMFDHWKLSTPPLSPPFAPHLGELIWKHVHSFPWCQRGSSNHPNPSLCMETPIWLHLDHNKNQSHSPLPSLKPFQTSLGASPALLTKPIMWVVDLFISSWFMCDIIIILDIGISFWGTGNGVMKLLALPSTGQPQEINILKTLEIDSVSIKKDTLLLGKPVGKSGPATKLLKFFKENSVGWLCQGAPPCPLVSALCWPFKELLYEWRETDNSCFLESKVIFLSLMGTLLSSICWPTPLKK